MWMFQYEQDEKAITEKSLLGWLQKKADDPDSDLHRSLNNVSNANATGGKTSSVTETSGAKIAHT